MAENLPSDIKTYTAKEAQAEWDGSRESKRRMILARVERRESNLALKSWDAFSASERKLVHGALNEDFISPVWYINTKGQRINMVDVPIVQITPEQLADEEGAQQWDHMTFVDRFSALLNNGIGRDAEQGQFARWGNLSPELRNRLAMYFRNKSASARPEPKPASCAQLDLF